MAKRIFLAYPETKIIGGKRYHKANDTFATEKQALVMSERFHTVGYSARVVHIAGAGYAVYFRGLGYR